LKSQVEKYIQSRLNKPLHILINNVVTAPKKRTETIEGLELQFATNVMSYVWMIEGLIDLLGKNQGFGRVVNVESNYAGDLDIKDLQFNTRKYENNSAYRQSKQIGRMLTAYFAQKYASRNCAFFSCHPGVVTTHLASDLGFRGTDSAQHASETPVWLASSPEIEISKSGMFSANKKLVKCKFCDDLNKCALLYQKCKEISDQIGKPVSSRTSLSSEPHRRKSEEEEKYKYE
jgi:NAD(P)-dependent dehydrogenase (short-subunit alcohol dehydrogenase family)